MKKEKINLSDITLSIDSQEGVQVTNLEHKDFPELYEIPISGKIMLYQKNIDKNIPIGSFESYYLNVGQMFNNEEDLLILFDDLGWDELFDDFIGVEEYIDEDEPKIEQYSLDCSYHNGIYIISDIKLKEKYRGNFISLAVIQTLNKYFNNGAGLTTILIKNDNEKIMNYFSRLGFAKFEDSNFIFINNALVPPTLEEAINDKVWKKNLEKRLNMLIKEEYFEAAANVRDEIERGRTIEKITIENNIEKE